MSKIKRYAYRRYFTFLVLVLAGLVLVLVFRSGGKTPRTLWPGGASRMLRGLMLRDLALLLVNRLKTVSYTHLTLPTNREV